MSNTLADLITTHGVEVEEHLDRQVTIPILTGMQRQGDVLIIPVNIRPASTPVPPEGTPVVRGENGGNTHAIVGHNIYCDVSTASAQQLTLVILTVPDGEVAYLAHPEHGYVGIGTGTYEMHRQRQMADEIALVQD